LASTLPIWLSFPAVLVTALLAATPAASAVIVASALVGSLIFVPSVFGLPQRNSTGIANTLAFIVASGLVVIVAQLYRTALEQLRDKENQRDLLVHELQHRGRNTYAIVESIVRNTLGPDSAKADVIAARVRAVSSANDLVNCTVSNDRAVPLRRLLDLVFGANAERISVSGPSIALSPTAIRTLSLVFHELLTNAMKYGALSSQHGMIAISWTAAGSEIRLHWIETGGPAISVPARSGFGTSVITHSLASLSGAIDFDFVSSGLQCTIGFNPNA
jgi:two-component sensor histidine kinase